MSSSAEAEVGALFMNPKKMLPLRITCEESGNIQPAALNQWEQITMQQKELWMTVQSNRTKAKQSMRFYLVEI